jgi:hypothetical protein
MKEPGMDTRKRRLSEDGHFVLGPDGEVIRELSDSEIAGLLILDTFQQDQASSHLRELLDKK